MLQFPLDETLGYRSKISLGISSQKSSNVFQRIIITPSITYLRTAKKLQSYLFNLVFTVSDLSISVL